VLPVVQDCFPLVAANGPHDAANWVSLPKRSENRFLREGQLRGKLCKTLGWRLTVVGSRERDHNIGAINANMETVLSARRSALKENTGTSEKNRLLSEETIFLPRVVSARRRLGFSLA
jgi:hypothetical protein